MIKPYVDLKYKPTREEFYMISTYFQINKTLLKAFQCQLTLS